MGFQDRLWQTSAILAGGSLAQNTEDLLAVVAWWLVVALFLFMGTVQIVTGQQLKKTPSAPTCSACSALFSGVLNLLMGSALALIFVKIKLDEAKKRNGL